MKIPVYQTGRVGGGNTLPGVSFSARKNPRAMAQAEMDKAAPLLTAMNAATQFAQKRYEFARDNLLDEALLSAQRRLRTESRLLAKDSDYNNVLDGENPKWPDTVEQVRSGVSGKLFKDKYTQTAFRQKFDQITLNNEFWLRNEIDTKIVNTKALHLDMLMLDAENNMANPDAEISDFENNLNNIGSTAQELINKHGIAPGPVMTKIRTLMNNVAEQTTKGYVGFDYMKLLALEDAKQLGLIDALASDDDQIKASALSVIPSDMVYTANALSKVSPGKRAEIIAESLKLSTVLDKFFDEQVDAQDKILEKVATTSYFNAFIFNKSRTYRLSDINPVVLNGTILDKAMANQRLDSNVAKQIQAFRDKTVQASEVEISGTDAQKLHLAFLRQTDTKSYTKERNDKLTDFVTNINAFADDDDGSAVQTLARLWASGELTADVVSDYVPLLTQETFLQFANKARTSRDTGFTRAINYLSNAFKVKRFENQEEDDLKNNILAAFSQASNELLIANEETPLSRTELIAKAKQIWNDNKEIVRDYYFEQYEGDFKQVQDKVKSALINAGIQEPFAIDKNNPIVSMQNYLDEISRDNNLTTDQKKAIKLGITRQINKLYLYQDTGIFSQ